MAKEDTATLRLMVRVLSYRNLGYTEETILRLITRSNSMTTAMRTIQLLEEISEP